MRWKHDANKGIFISGIKVRNVAGMNWKHDAKTRSGQMSKGWTGIVMLKTSHCLSNTGGDDLNRMRQICCHLSRRVNCWRVILFRCHWSFNGIVSWILARYFVKTKEWKYGSKHKSPLGKKNGTNRYVLWEVTCYIICYQFWSLTN